MMSANRKRETQGAAVAVDASTPHILPPCSSISPCSPTRFTRRCTAS
jgi:hypothetical protein